MQITTAGHDNGNEESRPNDRRKSLQPGFISCIRYIDMHTYTESRKSKRVKARLRVNGKSNGIFFSDFTRDVGLGGIGVETPTIIEEGTKVELFLHLPNEKEPLIMNGRVVWSKAKDIREKSSSNVVIGIQFQDVSSEHQDKLHKYIKAQNIDS